MVNLNSEEWFTALLFIDYYISNSFTGCMLSKLNCKDRDLLLFNCEKNVLVMRLNIRSFVTPQAIGQPCA